MSVHTAIWGEETLAHNRGFQGLGRVGRTQHTEHGDRVGRGNQRTKQQAIQEADVPAEQLENVISEAADDRGRDQYAEGGQQANGPAITAHVIEVNVQGAGKQQERQHPVHQQIAEIDLADQLLHTVFETRKPEKTQTLQQQRKHKGGDHDANRWRQADKTVIHIRE